MTVQPHYLSPVQLPPVPSYPPDFRPKILNEDFYNGSGAGIARLGNEIGAENVMKDGVFDEVMLKALDRVNGSQMKAQMIEQQAVLDPESVDAHQIMLAQAEAHHSLDLTRTILNRVVQAWKDIINTR